MRNGGGIEGDAKEGRKGGWRAESGGRRGRGRRKGG